MHEPVPRTIRLLLVDDHALFRESLARLLSAEADLQLVGIPTSVDEGLSMIEELDVDLLLLDFDLGETDGRDFLRHAAERGFKGRTLIVTAGLSDREAADLLSRGISGIFMKHSSPSLLVSAIGDVMAGKVWIDQVLLQRILAVPVSPSAAGRFTDRERKVLHYVFEGLTNKEIADKLAVSESSVKNTLQQLFSKTGVRTRGQLVRVALEQYGDEL
jgi:two-component system nitrate/nitrite response regulator NarL